MARHDTFYATAERRIEYLTLAVGILASAAVLILAGARAGTGLAAGAAVSWINFRWMKQGISALVPLATAQEGAEKPRVPSSVYFKFIGRYALLLIVAYVILSRLRLPVVYLIAGLFTVVAAVLLELIFELTGLGGSAPAA